MDIKTKGNYMEPTYFVDHGYDGVTVAYHMDYRVMGVIVSGEIYWYFNGFMTIGVI